MACPPWASKSKGRKNPNARQEGERSGAKRSGSGAAAERMRSGAAFVKIFPGTRAEQALPGWCRLRPETLTYFNTHEPRQPKEDQRKRAAGAAGPARSAAGRAVAKAGEKTPEGGGCAMGRATADPRHCRRCGGDADRAEASARTAGRQQPAGAGNPNHRINRKREGRPSCKITVVIPNHR